MSESLEERKMDQKLLWIMRNATHLSLKNMEKKLPHESHWFNTWKMKYPDLDAEADKFLVPSGWKVCFINELQIGNS